MAGRISMGARREVVSAVTERHRSANRMEKGRILDALCATTDWHRKHAVRPPATQDGWVGRPSNPTLRSAGPMLSKRHWLDLEIQNSFQLPANPMIDGQPNVCLSRVRLPEPLAGEQSAIEIRSGGMPGEPDEVGHILVVDDDVMVRQTITNYLEEHNVPAASVSSRQDLSRHLKKAHPSLILLDLRLGQEDGLEVLKEIRSHSHVPIIIMTGYSRAEVDRIVGLELGADDYLAKPFGLREMLARVRAVLWRHGMGRAAPARDPEGGTGLTAGRLDVAPVASPL